MGPKVSDHDMVVYQAFIYSHEKGARICKICQIAEFVLTIEEYNSASHLCQKTRKLRVHTSLM